MSKKALITGGSRGIGAACCLALANDGYSVVVNYNKSKNEAERIAGLTGGTAIQADVSVSADVKRMFDETGRVDLLVCSAGVALYGLFTDISDEDWRKVFDINVGGVINCCREAVRGMLHNKSGRIILISSMWGICGASCEAVYSASKAAIIGLAKSLAKELGPSGILVNCVAPGVIETDMLLPLSSETLKALRSETPLGRLGTTDDVVGAVRFLASEAASFTTGQVISPNGGMVI